MRLPPRAQASIEYMTIIALVVVGIVLMGPYVIRAINAHFRSLDDQVQDSFQEEITQSPLTNFNLPTCTCTDFVDWGCGLASQANCPGGSASRPCCGPYQRFWKKTCSPPGCDLSFPMGVTQECRDDATCCTPWSDIGCGTGRPSPPNPLPNCGTYPNCCKNQMKQTRSCNSGITTNNQCFFPHASCQYSCTGTIPTGSVLCAGDDAPPDDAPYIFVAGPGCITFAGPGQVAWQWNGSPGITQVSVKAWGGGGGGGGDNRQAGGGGGGGAYAEGVFPLALNHIYSLNVGPGGSPGSAGDASDFRDNGASRLSARGGRGGREQGSGNGGIATGGTLRVRGQDGTAGVDGGRGGRGGNSGGGTPIGAGGAGGNSGVNGSNGSAPGGGGGGGGHNAGTGDPTGGFGADGQVIVCYGTGTPGCTGPRYCEVYCPSPLLPNAAGTACSGPINTSYRVAIDNCCGHIDCETDCYCGNSGGCTETNPPPNATILMCNTTPVTSVQLVYGGVVQCGNPGTPGTACGLTLW